MISSCRCDPQLDTEMTAARAHACLLTARDDAVLSCASLCALRFFSLCRSPRVAYRRASARASRSLARRLDRGTQNQQCSARAFLWFFAVKTFFFLLFGRAAGFRNFGVGGEGRGGAFTVLGLAAKAAQCWCRWAPGCAPQGHLAAPQAEIFRAGGRIGRFGGQGGGLGQKMPFVGQPGTPRSRREEHFGIWEVGSKRPSSGGKGGHVLCLNPLIWRLLYHPTALLESNTGQADLGPVPPMGAAGCGLVR